MSKRRAPLFLSLSLSFFFFFFFQCLFFSTLLCAVLSGDFGRGSFDFTRLFEFERALMLLFARFIMLLPMTPLRRTAFAAAARCRIRIPDGNCVALPSQTRLSYFSSSCKDDDDDANGAIAFVQERGHSEEVAKGVIKSLLDPAWGVQQGNLKITVERLAGRWEIGEDFGLEALAKAVEREQARTSGKKKVKIFVHPPSGERAFECVGFDGMSLRDVCEHGDGEGSHLLSEYLECACDGLMACSTCHVYVESAEARKILGPPCEDEEDMLDLAHEPKDNSRLGCQIALSPSLDGMHIRIPTDANNLFDHIPFDQ